MICERKKVLLVRAMKTCGWNRGKAPVIVSTSTRRRSLLRLTTFRITPVEATAGWVANRVGIDVSEMGKSLAHDEVRTPDLPDRVLVTTLTEIFRMLTGPVHVAGLVTNRVGMEVSEKGKSLAHAEVRTSDLPDRILVTTLSSFGCLHNLST